MLPLRKVPNKIIRVKFNNIKNNNLKKHFRKDEEQEKKF